MHSKFKLTTNNTNKVLIKVYTGLTFPAVSYLQCRSDNHSFTLPASTQECTPQPRLNILSSKRNLLKNIWAKFEFSDICIFNET